MKQLGFEFIEFIHFIEPNIVRQIKLAKDWDSPQFRGFLINLEEQLKQGQAIHDNRNALVRIGQNDLLGLKREILVKKYKLLRKYDRFRFRFLPSKAYRSLEIALYLLQNGLNTPRPIAIVEDRGKFNQLISCYYLTEFLDCDTSFSQVIKKTDENTKRKIIIEAAQNIRLMHDIGIIHNDLNTTNILIKSLDNKPEFFFIDLNRAREKKNISLKARAKDLGRLALKQQDQSVFFNSYNPQSNNRLINNIHKALARRGKWMAFKRKIRRFKSKLFIL